MVQYLGLLASAAVPIAVGLVVSWLVGLLTCAAVASALLVWSDRRVARRA